MASQQGKSFSNVRISDNLTFFTLFVGQGVVLERCAYSDFVFLETMYKAGFTSKGGEYLYGNLTLNWMVMKGSTSSSSSLSGINKSNAQRDHGTTGSC